MLQQTKIFRVFVSSTFSDFVAERNALHHYVFPRISEHCRKIGARFQAIDLRWGVKEEAALDQQTMNICLEELRRCRQATVRPNFIILIGQRYGWCPLPAQIPSSEFEMIKENVSDPNDSFLLDFWYRRDDNAIPPEYCLQPRKLSVPESAVLEHLNNSLESEASIWSQTELHIRSILKGAIALLEWPSEDIRRIKYEASATHQEILEGALKVKTIDKSVFAYFRNIENLPEDENAKEFRDINDNTTDLNAQERLLALKSDLKSILPKENVYDYTVKWLERNYSANLERLCTRVENDLKTAINVEINSVNQPSVLDYEFEILGEVEGNDSDSESHNRFFFSYAKDEDSEWLYLDDFNKLQSIRHYVAAGERHPIVIVNDRDLFPHDMICRTIYNAFVQLQSAKLIPRFIGLTENSLDGTLLITDLCSQLASTYGGQNLVSFNDEKELFAEFDRQLQLASKKVPVILFLSSLEKINGSEAIRSLEWLPRELPVNTYAILSFDKSHLPLIQKQFPGHKEIHVNVSISKDEMQLRIERFLDYSLSNASRRLQEDQKRHFIQTVNYAISYYGLPLYVRIFKKFAFEEVKKWRSYQGIPEYNGNVGFSPEINGILKDIIWRMTNNSKHDEVLVSRCLGYLVASRYRGLAEDELFDILSQDVDVYERFIKSTYHIPPDLVSSIQKHLSGFSGDTTNNSFLPQTEKQDVTTMISVLRQDKERLHNFLSVILSDPTGPRLPIIIWARLHFDLSPYLTVQITNGTRLLCLFHRQFTNFLEEKYFSSEELFKCHQQLAKYFRNQLTLLKAEEISIGTSRIESELEFQNRVILEFETNSMNGGT
jgi:hypothetical protein